MPESRHNNPTHQIKLRQNTSEYLAIDKKVVNLRRHYRLTSYQRRQQLIEQQKYNKQNNDDDEKRHPSFQLP